MVWKDAALMSPQLWWESCVGVKGVGSRLSCNKSSLKQRLAVPVKLTGGNVMLRLFLIMPCSEWGDVHGKRRTHLNPEPADKMVFCYHNSRVADKTSNVLYEKAEAMSTSEWYRNVMDTRGFENNDLLDSEPQPDDAEVMDQQPPMEE